METQKKPNPIFDTDITKPIPVLIEEVRYDLVKLRGKLDDIGRCIGWKDRFDDTMGLLTCGIVVLHGIAKEITEAEDGWRDRDEKLGKLPKSYKVASRGLGTDSTPGCFVCGGETGLHSNISMFVNSKEDGEAITALFKTGARLDYRDWERGWIQVKVGACEKHDLNIRHLHRLVSAYPYRINAPMVQEAVERKDVGISTEG